MLCRQARRNARSGSIQKLLITPHGSKTSQQNVSERSDMIVEGSGTPSRLTCHLSQRRLLLKRSEHLLQPPHLLSHAPHPQPLLVHHPRRRSPQPTWTTGSPQHRHKRSPSFGRSWINQPQQPLLHRHSGPTPHTPPALRSDVTNERPVTSQVVRVSDTLLRVREDARRLAIRYQ